MTVNIHGKDYRTVAERLNEFWSDKKHEGWAIITDIISDDGDYIVIKTSVINADGRVIATGHAQEKYGSTNINKTSAVENCETSSIGRGLATYGLAGTEFASADEVATAIKQQSDGVEYKTEMTEKQKNWLSKLAVTQGYQSINDMANSVINRDVVSKQDATELIDQLKIDGVIENY